MSLLTRCGCVTTRVQRTKSRNKSVVWGNECCLDKSQYEWTRAMLQRRGVAWRARGSRHPSQRHSSTAAAGTPTSGTNTPAVATPSQLDRCGHSPLMAATW